MRRKLLSIILCLSLFVTVLPLIPVFAQSESFLAGDGTEKAPYQISSKTHLNNVREFLDSHFILLTDIVFAPADFKEGGAFYNNGAGWAPIGTDDKTPFKGFFDGNDKEVRGLKINLNGSETACAGLFGYNNGTIKTLGIVDSEIYATSCAGGIAADNSGTITNCYNTGKVTATASYAVAGGIVGSNGSGTITNCYNTGEVTGSSIASGIVGSNGSGTITNCYNTGAVTATFSFAYAGGIVGNNSSSGTITSCYNTGSITATSTSSDTYAGGIVGFISGTITNCYNTGSVTATSTSSHVDAGGIAGWNNGTITNCYNTGSIAYVIFTEN